MTAEEILQEFKDNGGDANLMMTRVPNLMAGTLRIIQDMAEDNRELYPVREMLELCESIINSEPVQVLFERIDRMKPLQGLK